VTTSLFEHEFETSRPSKAVFCHQDFLDKLAARRNEPTGKRAALLLQRMSVDIARLHYKATHGANSGWRRSRLGGGSGSHFYAWWAPAGAAPLKQGSFASNGDAVYLRDIRHHDDHAPLSAGDAGADYMPVSVPDLRRGEYAPEPWTGNQVRFARSHAPTRILKGHPGSGKTTALLHAADATHAERVLYLTFSTELAAQARDYFDRFCSKERTFTVFTFRTFLRQIVDWNAAIEDPAEARAQFRRDLFQHQKALRDWSGNTDALWAEMHAHLVGAALPEASGRFPKAQHMYLPDKTYTAQRSACLAPAAARKRFGRSEETRENSQWASGGPVFFGTGAGVAGGVRYYLW